MNYQSGDLFIDECELRDMFVDSFENLRMRLKSLYLKLLEVDYYYYIVKIIQNLPEGIMIVFVGTFAVFNLFKYNEKSYGNKVFPIITTSMYPEITPGSLVFLKPSELYKKGDIISYVEKTQYGVNTGKILTHRIIDVNKNGLFKVKGDANKDPDPYEIEKSQIQGKVVNVFPFIGYIDVLTKTVPGFFILIVAPSLLIIIKQLKEIRKVLLLTKGR